MATSSKAVKKKKTPKTGASRTRVVFRFLNDDHHTAVKKAAKHKGLSMNSWLVETTLAQARKELATK